MHVCTGGNVCYSFHAKRYIIPEIHPIEKPQISRFLAVQNQFEIFDLFGIRTEEFEFLDSVHFGGVAFSE